MNDQDDTKLASPTKPDVSPAQRGGPVNSAKRIDPNEIPSIVRSVRLIRVPDFRVGVDHVEDRPRLDINLACPMPFPCGLGIFDSPPLDAARSTGGRRSLGGKL